MRLLFLSNLYPPREIGGLEQICEETVDRLRARGHSPMVLTRRREAGDSIADEPWVRRQLHLQADLEHYRPMDFFLRRRQRELHNIAAVSSAIREHRPDAVCVWGMWNLSRQLARTAEDALPQRVAYYVASYWPSEDDMHLRYWNASANRPITEALKAPLRAVARRILRREGVPVSLDLAHVRCVSRYVRDTLVASGHLPERAEVLYPGIDTSVFARERSGRTGSRLRLLYCGSLLEHKGVHTAIEAIGALGPEAAVDLTIVGDGRGDYCARLEALVETHRLRDRVRFAGRVPRAEIPRWLEQADVFLFPSIWPEPIARSVMEAMAAGLLVIGSEVGGQLEMMRHGENALTFAPGNAAQLAEHIGTALREPARVERIAAAGRATVLRDFDIERTMLEMESWLESIAMNRGVRS